MQNIFWSGYSNTERHAAIDKIKSVITKYGDMVEVKFFSDISLTMVIEVEECKIDSLYDELSDKIGMDKFAYLNSTAKQERTLYLNVTFAKGTGNLAIEVPAVPG